MKKVMIAALFLLCVGSTVLAQTTPKKEPVKHEKKAPGKTATAKATTATHHAKKHDKAAGKQG